MKFLIVVIPLIYSCSHKAQLTDKEKYLGRLDSSFNKLMERDTYWHYDSSELRDTVSNTRFINHYSFVYDSSYGVRIIHQTTNIRQGVPLEEPDAFGLSDSIENFDAYFLGGQLYKIKVDAYPASKEGTKYDMAKAVYYLKSDSIINKWEHRYSLAVKRYIDHFDSLAKKFNDGLKIQ